MKMNENTPVWLILIGAILGSSTVQFLVQKIGNRKADKARLRKDDAETDGFNIKNLRELVDLSQPIIQMLEKELNRRDEKIEKQEKRMGDLEDSLNEVKKKLIDSERALAECQAHHKLCEAELVDLRRLLEANR